MAVPSWFDEYTYLQSKLNQLISAGQTQYSNVTQVKAAIEAAGMSVCQHFEKFSLAERTSPNTCFNTQEYLEAKAAQLNTAQGVTTWTADKVALEFQNAGFTNAYEHFSKYGWAEGVNPSNSFDVSSYLEAKAAATGKTVDEVKAAFKAAGLDPIAHYETYGKSEGITVTAVPTDEQVTPDSSGSTGQTFTLTTGVDIRTGTSGDDTFIADNTVSTQLSAADQINGGGGTDTLKIYQASGTGLASTVFGQLSNVENVYINNGTLANGTTLNVSTLTGVTSIALDSPQAMADGDTFTLKTASGQGVSLKGVVGTTGGTTSTFELDGAAEATLDGVGTDLTLDLASAGTSLKLTTAGSASTITLKNTGAALATLNLAGDKAIDITTTVSTLKTVASTSTGDVTIDNTGGAIETYTGAGGKDTLTLDGANVKNVSTGAGNDKVTIVTSALAAASAIDLGDGDDSLVVVAGGLANLTSGSQLNGGAGSNDKLVINDTAPAYSKINAAQGFEILGLAATGSTVDVAQLTSINRFSVEATTGASQTFNNAKSTSTFALDNTAGLGTIAISNAVGESATTIAIDNQSATAQTITAVNLTGITQVALSSTGKAGNTITTLGNNDNSNIVITGSADLKIANALVGTSTGSKVDASAFTGKLEVTGSSKADILIGGSGNDTITGGNGDDTINLTAGGSDTIVFSAAASNGKDTISGFTAGTGGDLAKVENADTTASTGSGSIAYATHNVVLVNGAAYSLAGADIGTESGAQTFASSDVIELVGGNEAAANLDAATDGSELLKYLGSTNAATQISVANNGDKAFLVAYDNGKAYLYHADAGADNAIDANEITLVGVFDGVASGAFVSANFQIA